MLLQIDMTGDTPIYVQLRNQIVLGIGKGELKGGEALPTVRQMASDLGINTMTVNKAYRILKEEGFIEIDRRHGARVAEDINYRREFREKLEDELELLIAASRAGGMREQDFLTLCREVFQNMKSAAAEDGE